MNCTCDYLCFKGRGEGEGEGGGRRCLQRGHRGLIVMSFSGDQGLI